MAQGVYMTVFSIIAFIAFLWIAHGFWCDYKEANRPRTEEELTAISERINALKLDIFHERLYLHGLASPWNPKYKKPIHFMFITAEAKEAYLKSAQWNELRLERLRIAQNKCEHCGSTKQLQCHHITYERLTQEHIDDLAILCGGSNGCHQRIHDLLGYDRTTEYPISILKD